MKAIAQIKNTQNKLVGYWIDERFITREEASENCDVIENLVLDTNGQIEFVGDVLPVWTLREVNQRNYLFSVKIWWMKGIWLERQKEESEKKSIQYQFIQ